MSLALACAWTLKGDYRFEGDWTQLGNSLGAAPEPGLGGAEGESGLESSTAGGGGLGVPDPAGGRWVGFWAPAAGSQFGEAAKGLGFRGCCFWVGSSEAFPQR